MAVKDAEQFKKRAMLRKHNKSSMPANSILNLNESFQQKKKVAETHADFRSILDQTTKGSKGEGNARVSLAQDDTTATLNGGPLSIRNSVENSNYTSVNGKVQPPAYMVPKKKKLKVKTESVRLADGKVHHMKANKLYMMGTDAESSRDVRMRV